MLFYAQRLSDTGGKNLISLTGGNMKIDFTKKEFKLLLDVFSIADWVLHAHKIEDDPRTKSFRILEQKIFSLAEKNGLQNYVFFDEELKKYFPTREFEENGKAMVFIEEFENDTFWDELIERLVVRDLIGEEGENAFFSMSLEEKFRREEPLRQKYQNEFAENGLDNLRLIF